MSEEELKAFRNLSTFSTKYIVNKKASSENDIATMFVYVAKLEVELEHKDKEIERLKEKLKFEEATNKELLSTGAELENKLYEEQDKNKKLKKELQEEIEEKEHYQAIVESWE